MRQIMSLPKNSHCPHLIPWKVKLNFITGATYFLPRMNHDWTRSMTVILFPFASYSLSQHPFTAKSYHVTQYWPIGVKIIITGGTGYGKFSVFWLKKDIRAVQLQKQDPDDSPKIYLWYFKDATKVLYWGREEVNTVLQNLFPNTFSAVMSYICNMFKCISHILHSILVSPPSSLIATKNTARNLGLCLLYRSNWEEMTTNLPIHESSVFFYLFFISFNTVLCFCFSIFSIQCLQIFCEIYF